MNESQCRAIVLTALGLIVAGGMAAAPVAAQPANDTCAAAADIGGVPQTLTSPLGGVTISPGDPAPPCYSIADTWAVWYRYTPSSTGQVRMDTTLSTANTVITVFTGECGALTAVDCDFQYGINNTWNHGMVDFLAEQGTTYRVMVSGVFQPQAGAEAVLEVTPGQSHPIDVHVRDAVDSAPLDGAHVWIRDTVGGSYTLREGFTDVAGDVRLYPPNTGGYAVQAAAPLHVIEVEPGSNAAGPAAVDVGLQPMGALPSPPTDPARIVFASTGGLRTMLPDGSDERLVVPGSCLRNPTWSPDGSRIAFGANTLLECATGWPEAIWIADADGSNLHILNQQIGGRPQSLDWSPDGRWLIYDYFTPLDGTSSIYRVDAETGAGPIELIWLASAGTYSPDGSMIAFQGPGGTRVAKADGSEEILLGPGVGTQPDWSPDGTRIAVGWTNLLVFDAHGGNVEVLKTDDFLEFDRPKWSPDGTQLMYLTHELSSWFLHRIDADGSNDMRIRTGSIVGNSTPDWADRPTFDVPGDASPRADVRDPDGGERLVPGETFTIRWAASDDVGIADQDLFLIRDGQATPIAAGLPATARSFEWTVPDLPSHINALVELRVRDTVGQDVVARSRYPFSIAGPTDPYVMLQLIAPAGGESYSAGETVQIAWVTESYWTESGYSLEYSLDGGKTFDYIDAAVPPGARSYSWTAPADVTGEAVVRVYNNSVYSARTESPPFALNVTTVEGLTLDGTAPTDLSWQPMAGGPVYDVIRGDLGSLAMLAGDVDGIDLGTVACGDENLPESFTQAADTPAPGEAWFYLVRSDGATTGSYGFGTGGAERSAAGGDCGTQATGAGGPAVMVAAPPEPLSGTTELTASVAAALPVVEVRFLVDGAVVGTRVVEPWTLPWDTTSVADGEHALAAQAVDSSGAVGTSPSVTVVVSNAAPSPPEVVLSIDAPSPLARGDVLTLTAAITAPSGLEETTASAGWLPGDALRLEGDPALQVVPALPPGASTDVTWSVRAERAGDVTITVVVDGVQQQTSVTIVD